MRAGTASSAGVLEYRQGRRRPHRQGMSMNTGKPGTRKISSVSASVGALIAALLVFCGGAAVAQTPGTLPQASTTVPSTIPTSGTAAEPTPTTVAASGPTGAASSTGRATSSANSG